jgi:hypothetical protein
MLVKVVYLKDHSGYKKGQEWAMLLNYAERFQREGVVRIIDGDVDKWIVKPEPEVEEVEDNKQIEQVTETEYNIIERLINNIK